MLPSGGPLKSKTFDANIGEAIVKIIVDRSCSQGKLYDSLDSGEGSSVNGH